jgi:hypothetical protein
MTRAAPSGCDAAASQLNLIQWWRIHHPPALRWWILHH